jgi:hypothetical protein
MPTMSARPNPQIWYTSSAGMRSSDQLARVRARGIAGDGARLAYFEWSAADGVSLDDPDAWAQANPAIGQPRLSSLSLESISAERQAMPDEHFGRERLGLWADENREVAIDLAAWSAQADVTAEQGSPVYAVATAPDRAWAAIGAAWRRSDGGIQVSLVAYDRGTAWIAARLDTLGANTQSVVLDTASRGLIVGAQEPSQTDQAQAHNAFSDGVLAGMVWHDDLPALNMSVRSAQWRALGDTRVLDRKGQAEISPLIAVAMAAAAVDSNTADPGVYVI